MATDTQTNLISNGHRIFKIVRDGTLGLYDRSEFQRQAIPVSLDFWQDTIIDAICSHISQGVARRLTAAAQRARAHILDYGVSVPGPAEISAEILFDQRFCRPNEDHFSRPALRDRLAALIAGRRPLKLGLPLFSRKPTCPLKNRGHLPDLAEIASLSRCHELATLLSSAFPFGVELWIYADGNKYNRACLTPPGLVQDYQMALRFWNDRLQPNGLVRIADYETEVRAAIGFEGMMRRELQYENILVSLKGRFDALFSAENLPCSLERIACASPLGQQLCFTFRSILSSVNYQTDALGERVRAEEDSAQVAYLSFMRSLDEPAAAANPRHPRGLAVFEWRREAWDAALRYVAISQTDRAIDTWKLLNGHGVKLTIHEKSGEIRFLPATAEFSTMTPQHCTGGLRPSGRGVKIDFRYRLEREAARQVPVILCGNGDSQPDIVGRILSARQPICYLESTLRAPVAAFQRVLVYE